MYSQTEIVRLAKAFCEHTGFALSTLSDRACGNDKVLVRLAAGADCHAGAIARASEFFDFTWPLTLDWPQDVPRPSRGWRRRFATTPGLRSRRSAIALSATTRRLFTWSKDAIAGRVRPSARPNFSIRTGRSSCRGRTACAAICAAARNPADKNREPESRRRRRPRQRAGPRAWSKPHRD
jgi:hypothetical protein